MNGESGKKVTEAEAAGRDFLPSELVAGYEAFRGGRFIDEQGRFRKLAERGQKPRIMLIGCADSRVAPEAIFDAGPGEIFVVRNVANLVPPYMPDDDLHGTSAALEFGVMALEVEHIVVMGHAHCGGVTAYARNAADPKHAPLSPGDFIGKWITLIKPAATRLETRLEVPLKAPLGAAKEQLDDYVEKLARESVIQGLVNLRSFPYIAEREAQGKLKLHGAYFGIAEGVLLALDEATAEFLRVA